MTDSLFLHPHLPPPVKQGKNTSYFFVYSNYSVLGLLQVKIGYLFCIIITVKYAYAIVDENLEKRAQKRINRLLEKARRCKGIVDEETGQHDTGKLL